MEKRNPKKWPQLALGEWKEHRFLDCEWYSICLEEAAEESWIGFTCKFCEIFKERKKEGDDV